MLRKHDLPRRKRMRRRGRSVITNVERLETGDWRHEVGLEVKICQIRDMCDDYEAPGYHSDIIIVFS